MEKFAALRPDYVIHVVSLDIVVDTTWGEASNPATWEFWIGAIRAGHVLAFVGGPPCETWSRARGQPVPAESANQGPRIMGSFAPKPTHMLVVKIPELLHDLHRNRVRRELPKAHAIGKDQSGHWRTTVLKEYAPAFCKSIAEALIRSFDRCESQTPAHEVPEAFLKQCIAMNCQDFGDYVGADFAH